MFFYVWKYGSSNSFIRVPKINNFHSNSFFGFVLQAHVLVPRIDFYPRRRRKKYFHQLGWKLSLQRCLLSIGPLLLYFPQSPYLQSPASTFKSYSYPLHIIKNMNKTFFLVLAICFAVALAEIPCQGVGCNYNLQEDNQLADIN